VPRSCPGDPDGAILGLSAKPSPERWTPCRDELPFRSWSLRWCRQGPLRCRRLLPRKGAPSRCSPGRKASRRDPATAARRTRPGHPGLRATGRTRACNVPGTRRLARSGEPGATGRARGARSDPRAPARRSVPGPRASASGRTGVPIGYAHPDRGRRRSRLHPAGRRLDTLAAGPMIGRHGAGPGARPGGQPGGRDEQDRPRKGPRGMTVYGQHRMHSVLLYRKSL
jgi:hypothetical protein